MLLRLLRALALCLLLTARVARGAEPLSVAVESPVGCPNTDILRQDLLARGLRGAVRIRLDADGEGGFRGEITTQNEAGASVTRRLSGLRCQTVAEGLVLIASVHLASTPAPLPEPAAPAEPPPRPWRWAVGALVGLGTELSSSPAFSGGLAGWVALDPHGPRGLALTANYGSQKVVSEVPVALSLWSLKLGVIPFQIALGPSTFLAGAASLSAGSLRAEAEVEQRSPGRRALWIAGLRPLIRQEIGPFFVDLGVEGTAALTRRTFEVSGLDSPLFSLPRLGLAGSLSVGLPLGS